MDVFEERGIEFRREAKTGVANPRQGGCLREAAYTLWGPTRDKPLRMPATATRFTWGQATGIFTADPSKSLLSLRLEIYNNFPSNYPILLRSDSS